MNNRERFIKTMTYQPTDFLPLHLPAPWEDTLQRWHNEGLPRDVDLNTFLGVEPLKIFGVTGNTGLYPWFEEKIIENGDEFQISIDRYGRTVRTFKDHTSMPHWLEFPVKNPEDLRRILDEHFSIENIDDRYSSEWVKRVEQAEKMDCPVLIDGGCYYWTLRSLAGVDGASYLFYDAPELVDELFERINIICLEGIRRTSERVKIDLIGYGEDIACKNGPLISPPMFEKFILPRYRKVMDLAHSYGITLTWYDSDGDIRPFIQSYLETGINCIAPCEVAAGMSCPEIRKQFGKEMRLIGGIDKREIAKGRKAIDTEIDRHRPMIEEGGFIPAIDHSVSADISLSDYRYFLEKLQKAIRIA